MVTLISDQSGHVCTGSRSATLYFLWEMILYLKLKPTILPLVMMFMASAKDCFCCVGYLLE